VCRVLMEVTPQLEYPDRIADVCQATCACGASKVEASVACSARAYPGAGTADHAACAGDIVTAVSTDGLCGTAGI
jgi:hypothetical protein